MSTEQNKALARRIIEEIISRGNMSVADELLAPDFVDREELPPGVPGGREGVKQLTPCSAAPSQTSKPHWTTLLPKATG
jgi:hypothetical protein